jgi:hypothetical protein
MNSSPHKQDAAGGLANADAVANDSTRVIK